MSGITELDLPKHGAYIHERSAQVAGKRILVRFRQDLDQGPRLYDDARATVPAREGGRDRQKTADSYGIPMESLWNPYGIPMEQHASSAPATRHQQASNTLSPRHRLAPRRTAVPSPGSRAAPPVAFCTILLYNTGRPRG